MNHSSPPNDSSPDDGALAGSAAGALRLGTPAAAIAGVGRQHAGLLQRVGIRNAAEALFCFPRHYEFPAAQQPLGGLREGEPASVLGTVTEVELRGRTPGKSICGVLLEDGEEAVRLVFYNQPFRAEQLVRGKRLLVSGTPKLHGLRYEFTHPKVEILGDEETLPEARILPVYPLTQGLKQYQIRRWIQTITETLADRVPEVLPAELLQRGSERLGIVLPAIGRALRDIHAPPEETALEAAKTRLVFQELLVLQLALALRRRRLTTDLSAPCLSPTAEIDARIRSRFPFALTGDQRAAVERVGRDMARQFPMNRLVQGDVGSGKTVVAQYAMLLTVAHGYQALLMAPTEILARQHFGTLQNALAHSRVRMGLLTGSLSASERRDLLARAAAGQVDVIVGTQALLDGKVRPAKLGLVVIDEQHKFGVGQRARLRHGGLDPHYLVLSATPIPRTMAMTLFGDLDVSTLREKPPGRKPVHTYLAKDNWRERWWEFLKQRLDEGRQAFVVTPRVAAEEEAADAEAIADARTASNAEQVYQELTAGPLADYRVGLLHGRLSPEAKRDVMQRFAAGEIQVLVSTTVIEVGIDVANATVMTILGAEHFGLAQLHQLRGRVARGSFPGHVAVFTDAEGSPSEHERLQVLAETDDGFALAEADFRLRGPGDLLGTRQSGMPPLRIADLQTDQAILQIARALAQEIVDEDPTLQAAPYELLRKQVLTRYGKVLDLGDVA